MPLAIVGTWFESPPWLGQLPAAALNSWAMGFPPDSGLKAYSCMLANCWEIGRDNAQMIGLVLPFDDTLVKKPPFCPVVTAACATLGQRGSGRRLQLPHSHHIASTAHHARQAIPRIHEVRLSTPAPIW